MRSEAEPSYLDVGKWRIRVPRRRGTRIALGILILVRGLVPTPTSPILLPAAITLLSKDVPWLRRLRRRFTIAVYRRRYRSKRTDAAREAAARNEARLAAQR